MNNMNIKQQAEMSIFAAFAIAYLKHEHIDELRNIAKDFSEESVKDFTALVDGDDEAAFKIIKEIYIDKCKEFGLLTNEDTNKDSSNDQEISD